MDKIVKNNYWNIVKGIAIISIVIGHCFNKMVCFVYLYHLAIFFFVSGYFYNEEKYGDEPCSNFIARLKNNWYKYVGFSVLYTLLHNYFVRGNFLLSNIYSIKDIVTSILNTLLFFGTESFGGAMWFVPVLILASTLFGFIIYFSRKMSLNIKIKNFSFKHIIIIFVTILCGILGIILNTKNINLMYHIQTIFLVIPFFTAGYYYNKCVDNNKLLKWYIFIPIFILLLYFAFYKKLYIDLSANNINNPYLFYIVSFLGIYFCLYVSKIIDNIPKIKKLFATIGTYSFEIMATHFVIFKIIDVAYSKMMGINDITIITKFPYAYEKLWPIYIICGVLIPTIITYFIKNKQQFAILKDKKNIINKIINSKKIYIILIILVVALTCLPYLKLGIMHNDELMSRYWSMQGFTTFYKHYFIEQIEKGRALSAIMIPCTMFLGFIGKSSFCFKSIQTISILGCSLLFSKLINKIFNNKLLSIFIFVVFIIFLPITFEPSVPNVFVTFYNVSLMLLILSFMLYYDFLNDNKMWKLVVSMILFFIVELSYESFITYAPIYILLLIYKLGIKNIFQNLSKNLLPLLLPILTAILYLILYIIFAKIFPSNYPGNQIYGINIINSIKILINLGKYTIPGSYLFSEKYQWLFNHYYSLNIYNIIRSGMVALISSILFVLILLKNKENHEYSYKSLLKITIISILMIFLPMLPISVSSMYQNIDIGNNLLGLPVSFFSYFGSVLFLSYFSLFIVNKFSKLKVLIIPMFLFVIFDVQMMNSTFSAQAQYDFKRIENIEELISSDVIKEYNNSTIYSKNIFELKDALFIHDNYWTEYSKFKGLNINFVNNESSNDIELLFDDINFEYIIIDDNNYYLITKNNYNLLNIDNYGKWNKYQCNTIDKNNIFKTCRLESKYEK